MKRARNLAAVIVILAGSLSHAEIANPLADAARPLNEGVPEVAVTRLQQLLKQNLSDSEWRLVAEKLLEALVAANQSADALKLADDPRLQHSSTAIFWHAQLFASLNRQTEALPLYRQLAADQKSALHAESLFGAAEMLRALGQQDEALQDLTALFRDSKWNVRAQLRAAEIYLDKSDAGNAQRLLEKTQPANIADKKQRHSLR